MLIEIVKECFFDQDDTLKTLMITHKVLASQQGYDGILEILGERFRDGEDKILRFFMNIVEPICFALETANMPLLFQTLGVIRYPIISKLDKQNWSKLKGNLRDRSAMSAIQVLLLIKDSRLIPIPLEIEECIKLYNSKPDSQYLNATISEYLDLSYSQFIAAINFLYPEAEYSTEHGVKGEEYDNVIFTISRGWNNYQFDLYAPMLINGINTKNIAAFERNRNLFYVCCSRPKKRLFIFVTFEVNNEFEKFLVQLVGKENYYTFDVFVKKYKRE